MYTQGLFFGDISIHCSWRSHTHDLLSSFFSVTDRSNRLCKKCLVQ